MVSIKRENRKSVIRPLKRRGHPPCGMMWHGVSRLSRQEYWDNTIRTVCPGFKQPRRRQEFTSLLNVSAVILLSIRLTLSIGHFLKEIVSVIWLQLPESKDHVWFLGQFVFIFRSRTAITIFSQNHVVVKMACLFSGITEVPGAEFLGDTVKFKGRSVVLRPCKKEYDARRVEINVDQN